ncbi:unnamed protein product [Parajaminaea phylloscopi]
MKLALATALLAGLQVAAKPVLEHRGVVVPEDFVIDRRDQPAADPLSKRGVTAETVCRNVLPNDLFALSNSNWQIMMNNANKLFNIPVTTIATPMTYKYDMFAGTNYGGWNARLGLLRQQDVVQYGQNAASTCLDGDAATMSFATNQGSCSINQLRTFGTSKTPGTQITLTVQQGYTLSTTVETAWENHVTWETTSGVTSSSGTNNVDIDQTTAVFGVDATAGAEVFGIKAETTLHGTYEHTYGGQTEKNNQVDTSNENMHGGDSVTSSSTQTLSQQDYTTSVAVQITPPTGYTCYVNVSIATCTGSAIVKSPITFPSGMVLFDFGSYPACLASDPGCSQGTSRYFYVPINTLLAGFAPSSQTDTLNFVLKANGQYAEHCDAPTTVVGNNGTGAGTSYDSTYVPALSCPKNLGIKKGCAVTMEDYLSESVVSGDTSAWAGKGVSYSQLPGAGQSVSFGQQQVTFNASTPYQTTTCSGLLQVVPDFAASFVPAKDQLAYPQDGSDLVGASYTVGYVSKCGNSQYGNCAITNVTSLNTKNFKATQTSPTGNPVSYWTFSNGGSGWPEDDVLTFNVECSDVYGNTGGVQSFQQAYRNDVATATLTASTATYTFQSTTQYLFSAIETLYTSMVTPVKTIDLKTQTLYIATTYTGTTTIPVYGAQSTYGGRTTTTVTSTSRPVVTATSTVTVKPVVPTITKTLVKDNTTTVTSLTSLPAKSVTVLKYPTVTATATKTLCQAVTSVVGGKAPADFTIAAKAKVGKVAIPITSSSSTSTASATTTSVGKNKREDEVLEDRKIHTTTTITDSLGVHTVTDYTNTATRTLSATTTSTDAKNWATSTVKSTSTYYDPFQTTFVYGTASLQSTQVVNKYTKYNTITRSTTVTRPSTTLLTQTTSVPQTTITKTNFRPAPTVTSTVTPAVSTILTALSTFTTTTTTTSAQATCTFPLIKT